jgi:hypothetical protein
MKVFRELWFGHRTYVFRSVGFRENDCNAFGSARLGVQEYTDGRITTKNYKVCLRNVWKLWGQHTQSLTNNRYDA